MSEKRLIGTGWHQSRPASELKVGDVLVYNYGYKYKVDQIDDAGKHMHVTMSPHTGAYGAKAAGPGQQYKRKMLKSAGKVFYTPEVQEEIAPVSKVRDLSSRAISRSKAALKRDYKRRFPPEEKAV